MNNEFYSEIFTESYDDITKENHKIKYTAYVPKYGHPIVLFSQTSTPLAALNLKYQNVDNYENGHHTFITELSSQAVSKLRPTDSNSSFNGQTFQGFSTLDDQNIEFVISNLTNESINFNIIKSDKNGANYGNLNEINSLRPFESCAIKSDKMANNKIIKLKAHLNDKSENVKLGDELSTATEKVGSYFYLSVTPRVGDSSAEFASTFWKPVDFFVVKTVINKIPLHRDWFKTFSTHLPESLHSRHFVNIERPLGINTVGSVLRSPNIDIAPPGSNNAQFVVSPWLQSTITPDTNIQNLCDDGEDEDNEDNAISDSQNESSNYNPKKCETMCYDRDDHDHNNTLSDHKNLTNYNINQTNILNSKVANIITGDEVVAINSVDVDIEYDYSKQSEPCILGLSVIENMTFNKNENDSILADVRLAIDSYKNTEFEHVISKMKIYSADLCCICLSEKPDIVFYRCGHVCTDSVCSSKLLRCPICRAHINAVINLPKTSAQSQSQSQSQNKNKNYKTINPSVNISLST